MDLKRVIIRPIITEKSMVATSRGQYAFEVDPAATKKQISQAVRRFFAVEPIRVRTVVMKGKERRSMRTRQASRLGNWKKALVTLKEGQKIDAFEVTE